MAHCMDVKDRRKDSRQAKHPLVVEQEALEVALAVAGVDVTPNLVIKLRVRDEKGGSQGSTRQVGPETFIVNVRVAKKDSYEDRHHYVINNSFVHELRHVAQMQQDPDFLEAHKKDMASKGYFQSDAEVEARFYGRLADHTGTKDTGPAGPAVGQECWGLLLA